MRQITIDDVMALRPHFTRDEVEEITGGRSAITLLEFCDVEMPPSDILMLLLTEKFLPSRVLHAFACDCAERALLREHEAGREPNAPSWAAVETKRRWLRGQVSNEELAMASAAAKKVARAAVCMPVWDTPQGAASAAATEAATAACSVAWEAASAVAWEAAIQAASAAGWAAASAIDGKWDRHGGWVAAWKAERTWQLKHLRELIEGSE